MNYIITTSDGEALQHHGIKGQKWGIRRYQNPDGSLTSEGIARYKSEYESYLTKRTSDHPDSQVYTKSKKYDEKIAEQYDRQSVGESFVNNFFLGPSRNMTYNMARAADKGKTESYLRAVFDLNAGTFAGVAAGVIVKKATGSAGAGLASAVAAKAVSDYTQAKIRNTGEELSLQQRALREKYTR